MSKFHINTKTLEPGKCSASQGNCPFGGDEDHYTSMEAARAESENQLGILNGWVTERKGSRDQAEVKKLMSEISEVVNNPALHQYGFPEDELVRHNMGKKLSELRGQLEKLDRFGNFKELMATTRAEDKKDALNDVIDEIAEDPAYSWDKVMPGVRRTIASRNLYRQHLTQHLTQVAEMPMFQKQRLELQSDYRKARAFGRAFREGIPLPKNYDDAFNELWAGQERGEAYFRDDLATLRKVKESYRAGNIESKAILGSKASKKAVEAHFADRERKLTEALETLGRSDTVNAYSVMRKAKEEGWEIKTS